MTDPSIEHRVAVEIEALHGFFIDWFSGNSTNSDDVFRDRFLSRFDPAFVLIPPAGKCLQLAQLVQSIRNAHGSNPVFRIAIRRVTVRHAWGDRLLATYEEWQRNARASTPPDNGRIASVLLRMDQPPRWLHLHETWLPRDVMQAGPYDF